MLPSAPHRALADWDKLHFLLCPSLIALRLLGKDGEKEKGCPTRQQEGAKKEGKGKKGKHRRHHGGYGRKWK